MIWVPLCRVIYPASAHSTPQEIRKFQKSTNPLIPKAPFYRLMREKLLDLVGGPVGCRAWARV